MSGAFGLEAEHVARAPPPPPRALRPGGGLAAPRGELWGWHLGTWAELLANEGDAAVSSQDTVASRLCIFA